MQVDFRQIINDYKKIINTEYTIPLSNNVVIDFTFKGMHLPHLLGLNKLVDIPILQRYANKADKKIGANYIWNGIKDEDGKIDTSTFCNSSHFNDIYEDKLKYFDLKVLLKPMKIICFDSSKVDAFVPKIDKVCYMFWDYFEESGKHGHFGIGFEVSNDRHYPNTFFFRSNNDYITGQEEVFPHSYYIKHKDKSVDFVIYWENIRNGLMKNSHYKYLKRYEETIGIEVAKMTKDIIGKIDNEDIRKHFRLLRLDEVKAVYLSYLEVAKTWDNKTKAFLIEKIDSYDGDYKPHEIKSLLNEVPQS